MTPEQAAQILRGRRSPSNPRALSTDDDQPPHRPSRRLQTQTERDVDGLRARRERERMQAIPEQLPDEGDVTGKYEGEELDARRARRPTPERIRHLERRHDRLDTRVNGIDEKVDAIAVKVGEIHGQMTVLPKLVDALEKSAHVSLTARVDVDKARAMEPIEVRRDRSKLVTQIVGGIIALATSALAIIEAGRC